MTTALSAVDLVSAWLGRCVAVLAVAFCGVFACVWILERIIKRAGLGGLFLKFGLQEYNKDQRSFVARLFWGGKSDQ